MDIQHWPPPYSVRVSLKAKRVQLKISHRDGLVIVIPKRIKKYNIPDLLDEHKPWIHQHLPVIQEQQRQSLEIPSEIHLRALNETWKIRRIVTTGPFKVFVNPNYNLTLLGPEENPKKFQALLKKWLRKKAQELLPQWLNETSKRCKLTFESLNIRSPKSRWGSCTRNKVISLNTKLLFIPHELVQHVLIHELCHTVHLNHSDQFWQLVAHFDPQWKQHKLELKRIHTLVPIWME